MAKMSDFLCSVANDVAEKAVCRHRADEVIRILQESFGGRFLRVSSLPDEWEQLKAVFVVVTDDNNRLDFTLYINHPDVARTLLEKGLDMG